METLTKKLSSHRFSSALIALESVEEMNRAAFKSIQPALDLMESVKLKLPDMSFMENAMKQADALSAQIKPAMENFRVVSMHFKEQNKIYNSTLESFKSLHTDLPIMNPSLLGEFRSTISPVPRRRTYQEPVVIHQNINLTVNIQQMITSDFIRPKISRWDEISINFINSHEVKIKSGEVIRKATFTDLGFVSKTTQKPKTTWELLEYFATCYGKISKEKKARIPNFKQTLSALRVELKQCFGIAEDPFQNDKNGSCRIKIDIAG